MICRSCPRPMPVVSIPVANKILSCIPQEKHQRVLNEALGWLLEKQPGLKVFTRDTEANYSFEETVAIADETGIVRESQCPFHTLDRCLLETLTPLAMGQIPEENKTAAPFMFLPAALARLIDRERLRDVFSHGEIADAKVARMSRNEEFSAGTPYGETPKGLWTPSSGDPGNHVATYQHMFPTAP